MTERRDTRGRRIGRNLWREHVTDSWFMADHAWLLAAEAASNGWAAELAEWRETHPRPRLREFMVALSPGWCRPAGSTRLAA